MKRKSVIMLALFMVISTSVLFFGLAGGKENDRVYHEIPDLENALILDGLSMESEELPVEDPDDSRIIMDDSFDDSIVKDGHRRDRTKEHAAGSDPSGLLEELRKKDNRWHVTPYTVKRSDNLWKIASRFSIPHRLIIRYNRISNPGRLKEGCVLHVPNREGMTYRIKKGETVSGIAKHYGVDSRSILASNNLNPSRIKTGTRIFIPDAREPEIVIKKKRPAQNYGNQAGPETMLTVRPGRGKNVVFRGPGFSWPLAGRITSGFGRRRDPLSGGKGYHCGIDISAELNTPVHAAADGTVIFSGWKGGYGNLVVVSHDNGYITVYAHNTKNMVNESDTVKKGSILALSGMTGAVTGAHVHFEIRKYLTPLDPMRILKR